MRLGRIDLIRYGHFTDRSFELPARETDFHIVFGPNETGKSTALAAIEDLLFGIPMQSQYNFLHDYTEMRIGALLENGSASLEMLRRKGNQDTLLDPDGIPLPGGESALRIYLAGADRSFFERMFSLDHVRLQAGGKEILEAKDDIGQMLFSAGAGIVGLRERISELSTEADDLWNVRRAKHRKFYIAYDKLTEAQAAINKQTITASKWRELKSNYLKAEKAYTGVDKKIKESIAERNLLSRIRRVFRDLRRKQELDVQLTELEHVITLPEDAAQVLAVAERKDTEAKTRIEILQEQLKKVEDSLDVLKFDEALVQRAEDIRQLYERRIEIRGQKADLPKHEAGLMAAEADILDCAKELSWTETDVSALAVRVPSKSKISIVRNLLNQRGELEAAVSKHVLLLKEAMDTHKDLSSRLNEAGKPADVTRLSITIKTVREQGDLQSHVRSAEKDLRDAQVRVERRLEILNPHVSEEKTLITMVIPARAWVQDYRDLEQEWKGRMRETQQQVSSIRQERNGVVAAFERVEQDEQVIMLDDINDARSYRDALWALVELKYLDEKPVPEDQARSFEKEMKDLGGAFELAVTDADNLADRRFDHAEAVSRLAEIKRKIGELDIRLEQTQEKEAGLVGEGEQLEAEWKTAWESAPFVPLAAGSMLEWLDTYVEILEALEERDKASSHLEMIRITEQAAREQLLSELLTLGVDVATFKNDDLNMVIEHAAEKQRHQESQAYKKTQLEEDIGKSARVIVQREQELQQATEAHEAWRNKWATAIGEIGLNKDIVPEAVIAQIDTIEQMRETASRIRSLRHDQIGKVKKSVADFEQVVEELVNELANDLSGQPAESAVLELEKRLADAKSIRDFREEETERVENLNTEINELEEKRRVSVASISDLKREGGVETNEALKDAIKQSDQKRSLEIELQQTIQKLQQDGDGKPLQELEEECEGVIIDEVAAREISIQTELDDLQQQQSNAIEERSRERDAYQAIGGDNAAAQSAANKQEAITEMREVAEQYVRVRTSALLLQWSIERYRREKQAPLLKRASALFKLVTGGSFTSLQVAFDDRDKAQLIGLRPGGIDVPIIGMSTGTADQLYLALRVAAIEDYLERADTLPFVADDLFINFDDDRAAAGFSLLGELSHKTQVLFFTHHQHLVDIARRVLGTSVSLVSLSD